MVPLLDTRAQNEPLRPQLIEALERVLDSGMYILGPEAEALETSLAAKTGTRHGLGMSSGTDALLVALMALEIGPGDEVLVPAFTFFATAGCVARLGATPVWVDSRLDDYNMDPADLERKITPRSKAVIPVHLFGQAAPMREILAVAGRAGLPVIEDAAQALGAAIDERPLCGVGLIGITSFYPTKNLGAFGDAGMLFTSDDALADKCRRLRNHGMNPRYYHALVGGNFRLDAMQAALLRVKAPLLDGYSSRRAANAATLVERLSAHAWAAMPRTTTGATRLVLPATLPGNLHVWNQFTVRVCGGRRDALRAHLAARKVGSEVYYPLALDEQECFRRNSTGIGTCPVARQLAAEVLSLPVYAEMSADQLSEVVSGVSSFFES